MLLPSLSSSLRGMFTNTNIRRKSETRTEPRTHLCDGGNLFETHRERRGNNSKWDGGAKLHRVCTRLANRASDGCSRPGCLDSYFFFISLIYRYRKDKRIILAWRRLGIKFVPRTHSLSFFFLNYFFFFFQWLKYCNQLTLKHRSMTMIIIFDTRQSKKNYRTLIGHDRSTDFSDSDKGSNKCPLIGNLRNSFDTAPSSRYVRSRYANTISDFLRVLLFFVCARNNRLAIVLFVAFVRLNRYMLSLRWNVFPWIQPRARVRNYSDFPNYRCVDVLELFVRAGEEGGRKRAYNRKRETNDPLQFPAQSNFLPQSLLLLLLLLLSLALRFPHFLSFHILLQTHVPLVSFISRILVWLLQSLSTCFSPRFSPPALLHVHRIPKVFCSLRQLMPPPCPPSDIRKITWPEFIREKNRAS